MSISQLVKPKFFARVGSIAQGLAYLLSETAASGSIPSAPEIFSDKKIVNVAEVNQGRYPETSGQWLENVVRTHLVLASWY